MLNLAIIGLSPVHPRAFANLVNKPSPNGEGLNGVARISMIWGRNRQDAEQFAHAGEIDTVLDSPTDALGRADGVLVLEDPGDTHLELARPYLEAGVPTFVDKPFAMSMEHARAMVELAHQCHTPLMSSSALRYAREILDFKARQAELVGEPRVAVSTGPNELVYYGVHAAEQLYVVMGPGIEWVQNHYNAHHDIVHVQYRDGRAATLQVLRDTKRTFHLHVFGTAGHAQVVVQDGNFFYAEQLRNVVKMVQTRENPIPHEEMLELIALLMAAKQSAKSGERVYLSAV
jgi:virulence factor